MVSIDSEHSSRVHTFTEGVDYHIDSMIIKHHLFIGIDLENDTTHEKSHITVIFCPMAHAASSTTPSLTHHLLWRLSRTPLVHADSLATDIPSAGLGSCKLKASHAA